MFLPYRMMPLCLPGTPQTQPPRQANALGPSFWQQTALPTLESSKPWLWGPKGFSVTRRWHMS